MRAYLRSACISKPCFVLLLLLTTALSPFIAPGSCCTFPAYIPALFLSSMPDLLSIARPGSSSSSQPFCRHSTSHTRVGTMTIMKTFSKRLVGSYILDWLVIMLVSHFDSS